MALNKAEQQEFEELKKRAMDAESAMDAATSENAELLSQADDLNVEIAQAAIDKQDAIDEALEVERASMAAQLDQARTGKTDKSFSPKVAPKFDRGEYFAECFGGDIKYAQNGWFYNAQGSPVQPVNNPK